MFRPVVAIIRFFHSKQLRFFHTIRVTVETCSFDLEYNTLLDIYSCVFDYIPTC